jgi:CRISPR system Cascade subunit CasE
MYRTILSLRRTLAVRDWLRQPYRMHQRLALAWPDGQRDARVLWRSWWDEEPGILVQSHAEPPLMARLCLEWDLLFAQPACDPFEPELHEGAVYRYDLVCSPSIVSKRWTGGFYDPAQIGLWLGQKAPGLGAQVTSLTVGDIGRVRLREKEPRSEPAVLARARLTGTLICRDAKMLADTVRRGVGRGKAFGLGLLMLKEEGRSLC